MEPDDELSLLVPPEGRHLRAVRLVTADAGIRAGLDSSQIDDLRIAVDELCHAVMHEAEERVLVRIVVETGRVTVTGSAPSADRTRRPTLGVAAELIVDAATDRYALDADDGTVSFVAAKQTDPADGR